MSDLSYEERQRNRELAFHAKKIRPHIDVWAKSQTSLNAACARAEFESAVLEAVLGYTAEWQYDTGSDLCDALGHYTLRGAVDTVHDRTLWDW